tara:strand:+ start:4793 stop:5803 length:1011 start_codon:yes stop_codon:yes gene_type:complete
MYRDYILVLYDQEGTKAIVDEITSNVEFKRYHIQHLDLRNTHDWQKSFKEVLKSKDNNPKLIISGTSLNHKQWYNIWETAFENKIKIIAIVDSWQNLQERFITCSKERSNWPTIVCVIDKKIESTIKLIKGMESQVIFIGHPILSRLYEQRYRKTKMTHNNLLYVSEPIVCQREKYDATKLTRLQRSSFSNLCEYASIQGKDISIRLHPRETNDHFVQYKLISDNRCKVKLEMSMTKQDLLDINWVAFGLTSMLLIELHLSGSNCISLLEEKANCEQSFFKYHTDIIPRIDSKEKLLRLKVDEPINTSSIQKDPNTFIERNGHKMVLNIIDQYYSI